MADNDLSDDQSDSTVEETLVMLNLPSLNIDENRLKNLNTYRKQKGNEIYIERKNHDTTPNDDFIITSKDDSNYISDMNTVRNSSNNFTNLNKLQIDLTNEHELVDEVKNDFNSEIGSNDIHEKIDNNKKSTIIEILEDSHEELNNNKEHDDENIKNVNNNTKRKCVNNNDDLDNIPFEINSISLKNLFNEYPECIINNKYKFKGVHTSSIGTNLYFKEPENIKNKKLLKNCDISYKDYEKSVKGDNYITRDDFAIYEGFSTKIISFEIDY
ncbi:conserved Plasmodium protein, unknown function [Plasmodium berghei]|uniref:Uncharacterized protein n=2 Tax=Plasmodium berghei TaxID=5821 RepID=A0A509AP84_PLABA|nr:conserved Plasmodium protein, unknown function [Plasmodium berghei ANKA]CXJ01997.1 conserved Plasmodium protein, unknown function [Plasmodium berghei]SCL98250.1 conserved Plasmodium protein, unknown function [Plasmodium berghei]SCM16789.1 conserved Plasmodium protein, unknown function [Plasmodium berghei]SCM18587.1 conserved Plasmodium protein, unknown function [Plasmodium berghei]SCN28022.1 conserved Plasmodium protein, unknown function [Plasmodium berghei]|eukprot:XP_034423673.1 conserved Plasmodium protein, unknown function [Plasmodium berghei ANKA]